MHLEMVNPGGAGAPAAAANLSNKTAQDTVEGWEELKGRNSSTLSTLSSRRAVDDLPVLIFKLTITAARPQSRQQIYHLLAPSYHEMTPHGFAV